MAKQKKVNIKNIFYINEININDFIEKIKNTKKLKIVLTNAFS